MTEIRANRYTLFLIPSSNDRSKYKFLLNYGMMSNYCYHRRVVTDSLLLWANTYCVPKGDNE